MALLCLGGFGGAVKGGDEGVPGEAGALDAHRELAHAGEHGELADRGLVDRLIDGRRDHRVKAVEERDRLVDRAALDGVGHERRGRLRDRAAGALERDVRDAPVVEAQTERQLVAAERIVARAPVRLASGERAEVARPAIVVEDDFLVEVGQIRHRLIRRIPTAAWPPRTCGPCPTAAPRRSRRPASVTPGMALTLYRTSLGSCCADGHAGLVSVILISTLPLGVDHDVVDETELVDVDRDLRVVDRLERLDDRSAAARP